LHKELGNTVPLPKVYDLFEENEDSYLVMEFIKGKPLTHIVNTILKGRTWQQLDNSEKLSLLSSCLGVLDIVERMHSKGYIHRDITPANFLVDKNRKIWMIDLELSYNKLQNKPQWPFRLGTPGFISPEQDETLLPTVEQDIYAIGSLLIFALTGLMPEKFSEKDIDCLKEQLHFFIPSEELVDIISSCKEKEPRKRPTLSHLRRKIMEFEKREIQPSNNDLKEISINITPTERNKLAATIQNGLMGLRYRGFLNDERLWVSSNSQEDDFLYSHNKSLSIKTEYYQGLSGILWLLARANALEFSLEPCKEEFNRSLTYVQNKIALGTENLPGGFYFGTAGMAMAIIECINKKIITETENTLKEIAACLKNNNLNGCGIAKGLAGQGMVLLKSSAVINDDSIHTLLENKVNLLLRAQHKDGSWITTKSNDRQIKSCGFGYGVSGITCFLINYLQYYEDSASVRQAVSKAMQWLSKLAAKKKGYTVWPLHADTKSFSYDFQEGLVGVCLAMIKAYEILDDAKYKFLAEDCLRGLDLFPVSADITQANGLTGWGEVYLEAEKIFGSGEWRGRANWIVELVLHHYRKESDSSCYWVTDNAAFKTAGLMKGNAGIIHFLLRYYEPDKLGHPLLIY
jgi:serine/threonine protein kinase